MCYFPWREEKKHSFWVFLGSDKSSCGGITESVALMKYNPGRKHLSLEECLHFTRKAGSLEPPVESMEGSLPLLGVQGCGIKVAEGVEKKRICSNILIKRGEIFA